MAADAKPPHLLFELIQSAQHLIPPNHTFVAFGVLLVGMITGIDGSGFAGLPLTGTLSGALAPAAAGMDPATLAAVGQMGAVWTGGGTLIAWSSLMRWPASRGCRCLPPCEPCCFRSSPVWSCPRSAR